MILEEVFSDPVKDILVSKLQSEYPTYIKKISKAQTLEIANPLLIGLLGAPGAACADVLSVSNTTSFTSADSGLMIFVKKGLNFVPFTQPAPYDVATVTGSNQGVPWGGPGQIAVDTFEFDPTLGVLEAGECYLEDCLSSKAVAMVRVANPVSGDVHNIAFSHLQAWYEPDQVAVREKQFAIAKDLFTSSLTPAQLTSQPSFYTGDSTCPARTKSPRRPARSGASSSTRRIAAAATSSPAARGRARSAPRTPVAACSRTAGGSRRHRTTVG